MVVRLWNDNLSRLKNVALVILFGAGRRLRLRSASNKGVRNDHFENSFRAGDTFQHNEAQTRSVHVLEPAPKCKQ